MVSPPEWSTCELGYHPHNHVLGFWQSWRIWICTSKQNKKLAHEKHSYLLDYLPLWPIVSLSFRTINRNKCGIIAHSTSPVAGWLKLVVAAEECENWVLEWKERASKKVVSNLLYKEKKRGVKLIRTLKLEEEPIFSNAVVDPHSP